jgi:hypothetical protein
MESAMSMTTIAMGIALFACSVAANAQWLTDRTPGIPRLPDGKPNLSAPTPRAADGKPDFSGIWIASPHPAYMLNIAADLEAAEVQPWATELFVARMNDIGKDDPASIGCAPFGPRSIFGTGLPESSRAKIVQTPTLIVILQEDLTYRQVLMDGRKLPPNPNTSFMGYSIGRWEGEELVVESEGFKDSTWLDFGGHPHSEALHITERYRRVDLGHIQRRITLTDAKVFAKPITISSDLTLVPDTELLEYVCAETPPYHLVGRTEEEQKVRVPPEILAKYVGIYDFEGPNPFNFRTLTLSLSGSQLFADFNGKGRVPMVAMSNTMFSPRLLGTYEFFTDEHGTVTHAVAHSPAADFKIVKRRDTAR